MNRLIQAGLMYGNLIRVDTPALVDRYNRALEHLTRKRTGLGEFHIDISGFSPEVGDELGDPLYLNQNGVNRQFILLTTRQKSAPLLNARFSTSRSILRQFIDGNEAQLFALTARDAVAGELVNSVFDLDQAAKLMDIRRITVEADTTTGTLRDAATLAARADRFLTEEDAWFDDALIAEMIELAKKTGDVTRNPVTLKQTTFTQDNYWTSHLGGLYLFSGVESPGLLARDPARLAGAPLAVTDLGEARDVAAWLHLNGLVQPLVSARGIDAAAVLRQKMDFIVVDTAQDSGIDLSGATRRDMRAIARDNAARLPEEYHQLRQTVSWLEEGGRRPRYSPEDPAYFYLLRAAATPDRDLVNRLLSELAPKDLRQLFICHKELFYDLYQGWGETKKSYVVDFLQREYLADKAGAREALFGEEEPMAEPAPARDARPRDSRAARPITGPWSRAAAPAAEKRPERQPDPIPMVGPWGAVIRERD